MTLGTLLGIAQKDCQDSEELVGAAELLTTARSYFARFRGKIRLDKHGILVRSRTTTERMLADTP